MKKYLSFGSHLVSRAVHFSVSGPSTFPDRPVLVPYTTLLDIPSTFSNLNCRVEWLNFEPDGKTVHFKSKSLNDDCPLEILALKINSKVELGSRRVNIENDERQ